MIQLLVVAAMLIGGAVYLLPHVLPTRENPEADPRVESQVERTRKSLDEALEREAERARELDAIDK